uniref:Intraflagellar transport protein 20 homolog n=1 Tax=Cacopsylla melanoneura TaxID=428564 RepID=A0A8D8X7V4_9HEMI
MPGPSSLPSLDPSGSQIDELSDGVKLNGGIIIDDVHSIRVLDPQVTRTSEQLRSECSAYVEKIQKFDSMVSQHLEVISRLASEVNKYKISTIGCQNQLESISKQRETQRLQLQALILEKSMELERLKVQNLSLQKTESEQQDIVNEILAHK